MHTYVVGDIHGNLSAIYNFVNTFDITNSAIISVGDFGYGFSICQLQKLQQYLKATNNKLYINRGNHDNYYNHYPYGGTCEYENLDRNIINFTKDYSIHRINNKRCIFIHGAISIDRTDRVKDTSWWEQEPVNTKILTFYGYTYLSALNIDVVVSHSAPLYFAPYNFSAMCYRYFQVDPTLETELIQEREYLNNIQDAINPSIWVHGHFHNALKYDYCNTKVLSLGVDQFVEI